MDLCLLITINHQICTAPFHNCAHGTGNPLDNHCLFQVLDFLRSLPQITKYIPLLNYLNHYQFNLTKLTIQFQVHASYGKWSHKLLFHIAFVVHEQRWQVLVGVVWYAHARHALEELCGRKLACQLVQLFIQQFAKRNAAEKRETLEFLFSEVATDFAPIHVVTYWHA